MPRLLPHSPLDLQQSSYPHAPTTMFATIQIPISQNSCGNSSCNCGDSCQCKIGECKC
ncbi:hypothetical protein DFH09DRAFT_1168039 [Mycena vulgaris]|nr:hypothetical protein DFH09DRAFT_1168039 [Mycena vulgaris]